MTKAKIKYPGWESWTIQGICAFASLTYTVLWDKYFHCGFVPIFFFLGGFGILGAYLGRKLEHKPIAGEFKDLIALVIGMVLTFWIPLVPIVKIVSLDLAGKHTYTFALLIGICVLYSLMLIAALKKFGYLRKLV